MTDLKSLPRVASIIRDKAGPQYVVLPFAEYKKLIASLPLTGKIDEAAYLKTHADVREAVAKKAIASATEHYKKAGYVENRVAQIL